MLYYRSDDHKGDWINIPERYACLTVLLESDNPKEMERAYEMLTNHKCKNRGEQGYFKAIINNCDYKKYYVPKRRYKTGMIIKIKYFNKEISRLEKIAKGDWIDLRCAEPGGVTIKAGGDAIIKLGVGMILPDGYEAHIAPRSSTFKKYGILLTNSVGVIDGSYNGDNDEWLADVYAVRDTYIPFNERFLQFRIMPVMGKVGLEEVEKLNDKDRGGYGSTDSK